MLNGGCLFSFCNLECESNVRISYILAYKVSTYIEKLLFCMVMEWKVYIVLWNKKIYIAKTSPLSSITGIINNAIENMAAVIKISKENPWKLFGMYSYKIAYIIPSIPIDIIDNSTNRTIDWNLVYSVTLCPRNKPRISFVIPNETAMVITLCREPTIVSVCM